MRVRYRADRKAPQREMRRSYTTMERAATKAMRELAKIVQQGARAEIARGGLSKRWQTGFRARAKPRRGYSLKTSMRGYHRIGYANIFERGGIIRPKTKPLLWVPMSHAPQRIARQRITPKLFNQRIGPLHVIDRAGKAPLLAGYVTRDPSGRNVTIAQLRAGAQAAAARRAGERRRWRRLFSVPIFVGVKSVRIPDLLDVDRVYRQAAARLPRVYQEQMAKELTSRGRR